MDSNADLTRFADAPVVTGSNGYPHVAVALSLACPYCAGALSPVHEWENREQVYVGTECDSCLATWDRDGESVLGPSAYAVAHSVEAAELAEHHAAEINPHR